MGRIRVEQVTSDNEIQARLNTDKLRWTGGVKLGLGMAFLKCLENIHKNMRSVNLPLLILHGDNDSLCQPAGSHLLAREAASQDKKIKMFKGASHHLILEVNLINLYYKQQYIILISITLQKCLFMSVFPRVDFIS